MASFETALEHITLAQPNAQIGIAEKRGLSTLVLRVDGSDTKIQQSCKKASLALPEQLMTTGKLGNQLACWISPDEFLVIFPTLSKLNKAQKKLNDLLQQQRFAMVDTSGTYTYLLVSGKKRIDTLQKLCKYDLQHQFPVGKVVSSMLSQAPIIMINLNNKQVLLLARNSFADYIYTSLKQAANEYL